MASTHSMDADHPQSIAAAKLERQNKRIEATNAALTAQALPEKHKQSTRTRSKAWKPFDFAAEANVVDLPAVESRVNVFRMPSQSSSMSRPVSRISSHTQDSSYTESERHDSSAFLESDDFQVFTGRKKGRPAISAFQDKPAPHTATVEATFSKRDITDVFGNELPGPGFMDGNIGNMDGQLQFIQHPNGDVSAHQWSASRFFWENIGQFSNIRKKIEGQLAADRLKGETAWQSLQQNTLAYFRTVAKQREAGATGRPFGFKEIAACLSDTRPPSTAPTGPRRVTSKVEMPERPSTMPPRQEAPANQVGIGNRESTAAMPPKSGFDSMPRTQGPPTQLDQRLNPARMFTPTVRDTAKEDPFVTGTLPQYPQDFTGRGNMPDQLNAWSAYQPWPHYMPVYSSYGYAVSSIPFPNQSYMSHAPRPLYGQSNMNDLSDQVAQTNLGLQPHLQLHQQSQQPEQPRSAQESPDRTRTSAATPLQQIGQAAGPQMQNTPSASSKAASPLDTRSAMREHVMKMGEQAKERTKSQANIGRTVLYDPFQDQKQKDPTPIKQEALPATTSYDNSLGHFPTLGLGMIPGLGDLSGHGEDPFPTTLAPSVKMPFNTTASPYENDLRDSSPDRDWQRSTEASNRNEMPVNDTSTLKPWDADQLDEWLWSGNKFARQEDFHQQIMASAATPNRRTNSSSTSIRPIAPPTFSILPKKQPSNPTQDSNILTNRLLVPVLENLASYVQGPMDKRRDYFCQWTKAPEWAIDRSANGNDSFFDSEWGQPPARLGRDPRYQPVPRALDMRFGSYDASPRRGQTVAMPSAAGMERRFGFGGRF